MRKFLALCAAGLLGLAAAPDASAQEFEYLGRGSLSNNDWIGDGHDRWQSGGSSYSWMFGPNGQFDLPDRLGALFELRLRGQVITPENMTAPAAWDRPAAGVVTTTLHSHAEIAGFETVFGAGIAATGPQTRLFAVQRLIHELTPANEPPISRAMVRGQIGNGFYATAQADVARSIPLGDQMTVRPFVEGQAGVENLARAGVDVFLGSGFSQGILARDGTTGFLYHTLPGAPPPGVSLTAGADAAHVFSSALLPDPAYDMTAWRLRARAGVLIQAENVSFFQGVSWLGREFTAQPTSQMTGVFSVKLRF